MCIKKVDAWEHGGSLFPTEKEAVDAALKDMGQTLMKEHSSDLSAGLLVVADKLIPLLKRHAELRRDEEMAREEASAPTVSVYEMLAAKS